MINFFGCYNVIMKICIRRVTKCLTIFFYRIFINVIISEFSVWFNFWLVWELLECTVKTLLMNQCNIRKGAQTPFNLIDRLFCPLFSFSFLIFHSLLYFSFCLFFVFEFRCVLWYVKNAFSCFVLFFWKVYLFSFWFVNFACKGWVSVERGYRLSHTISRQLRMVGLGTVHSCEGKTRLVVSGGNPP